VASGVVLSSIELVTCPEGKRPLGRPRRRWVDNIKMDLLGIGWSGVDWIGLAQDRDKWRAFDAQEALHSMSQGVSRKQ
jgi:hypothetical protein